MPWLCRFSSDGSQRFQFSFSRQQFAIFIGGAFILLTISFSMGFLVAERQAVVDDNTAFAASGSAPTEAEATVKIAPKPALGKKATGTDVSNVIKPVFYKELLGKKKPNAEGLDPLKLPIAPMAAAPDKIKKPLQAGPQKDDAAGAGMTAPKSTTTSRTPKAAAKPSRAPAKILPKASTKPRYTIQVVSVKEPAHALKIHKKLREKGFDVFIQRVDLRERGVWLRIRVGKFSYRNAAARMLRELHAKTTVKGGQIVPL